LLVARASHLGQQAICAETTDTSDTKDTSVTSSQQASVNGACVEIVEGARTLRDVRADCSGSREGFLGSSRGTLREFIQHHHSGNNSDFNRALARLAFTAALSAVLSFVGGLGDRHHENFMVTTDGRLLHVDYGYSLGREPLDSVLIHLAVQGERPVTTLQYEELNDALGADRIKQIFWPVVTSAYRTIRQHAGLLLEMLNIIAIHDARGNAHGDVTVLQRAWGATRYFVGERCAPTMCESCADRFIQALLRHCGRREWGTQLRDELKGLCLREKTQNAVLMACNAALSTGTAVSIAAGAAVGSAKPAVFRASQDVSLAAKGAASDLLGGMCELWFGSAGKGGNHSY